MEFTEMNKKHNYQLDLEIPVSKWGCEIALF